MNPASPGGTAPQFTSANATAFTVGAAGSFNVTATGSPAPTLSVSGALPVGVTFTPATGALAGTPAAGTQGSYPLVFTATNGVLPNATQNFSLTVNPAIVVTQPAVTTTSPATAITTTSATLSGNVTSIGGGPLSARGIVLALNAVNPAPAIGGAGVTVLTDAASSLGAFSENATGLLPGTNYAFRAFGTNAGGTSYGATVIFTTATQPAPVAAGAKQPAPAAAQQAPAAKKTINGATNAVVPAVGSTATLSLTITNPNATALTGVGLVDTMPAGSGITVVPGSAFGSCGAGIVLLTSTTVTLAGGTLPALGSCTFSVTITAAKAGSWANQVSANANGTGYGPPGTATIQVGTIAPPKSG